MIVVIALVSALTIVTMGVPSLLMLAGACAFAVVANRWFESLSGLASWAAGIVVEAIILCSESAILAQLAPHPHDQYVYFLVLVLPLIMALSVLGWLISTKRAASEKTSNWVSGEPIMALMVIVLIEAMFEAIKLHGHDFGLSWAMWGDARNHVLTTRNIIFTGGITLKQLKDYPAIVNALCAILDGASGRANLSAGILLTRDLQAQVAVFILSSIALAMLFIAAVVETVPRGVIYVLRLPINMMIPLMACGSLGIGAFVLGLALSGGYLSAIGSVVFAMASVVLGMRIVRHYSDVLLILLTLSLLLVMTSWTFLFVVPASSLLVGNMICAHRLGQAKQCGLSLRAQVISAVTLFASIFCLIAVAIGLIMSRSNLIKTLRTYGGILGPNPHLYVWLGMLALGVVALAPSRQQRCIRAIPLLVFLFAGAVVLWIHNLSVGTTTWLYYATKMLWLATCCIIWIPFVLLMDLIRKVNEWYWKPRVRFAMIPLISLIGSATLLVGLAYETPFSFPLTWAFSGSPIPSPKEVSLVIREANVGGPFVIWDYYSSINDRLGNFWSALTWDYTAHGVTRTWAGSQSSFQSWAYVENGSLASLCTAVSNDRLRIVTRSPTLLSDLNSSCPGYIRGHGLSTSATSP
jgi:hypothetical protein